VSRAKRLRLIVERVGRCSFCGRETDASPLGRRENRFCRRCLPDRMSALSQTLGDVRWRQHGEYIEFVIEGAQRPR
jgi:hypothetical protein